MFSRSKGFSSILILIVLAVIVAAVLVFSNTTSQAPKKSGASAGTGSITSQSLPSYIDAVSYAPVGSLQWSHTVSGVNRFLVVYAAYRVPAPTFVNQLVAMTFDGQNVTKLIRTQQAEYVTEVWYLNKPNATTGNIIVGSDPNISDLVLSAVSFVNVNNNNPLVTVGGYANKETSITPNLPINLGVNDIATGVLGSYTGSGNIQTPAGTSSEIWHNNSENVLASGAVVSSGATSNLKWTQTVAWPWSISAIGLHLLSNPNSPTVDIKGNTQDGPLSLLKGAPLTLTWSSKSATTCTASGGWSGAKATSGTEIITATNASATYTLTCKMGTLSAADSVVVNVSTFDKAVCWNRGASIAGTTKYFWIDACKGSPTTPAKGCPIRVEPNPANGPGFPMSSDEIVQFKAWIAAGRPKTPCQ